MARFYPALEDRHRDFIAVQKLFFTATAPADDRMTQLFCCFGAEPLILRLYGRGQTVRRQDAAWTEFRRHFPALPHEGTPTFYGLKPVKDRMPGERQPIVLDIDSVQTSCSYAVPLFDYRGERDSLARWAEKKGPTGLFDYWREENTLSIDGLPTGLLENP
jgi:hypothetical protein